MMLEDTLVTICRNIFDKATEIKDILLQKYGIKQEDIDNLGQALTTFVTLKGTPKSEKAVITALGQSIDELIAANDALLRNQLDNIMVQFEEDNGEFYTAYKHARKMINYGHRYEKPEGEPVP